jgi:hypothetical protein
MSKSQFPMTNHSGTASGQLFGIIEKIRKFLTAYHDKYLSNDRIRCARHLS